MAQKQATVLYLASWGRIVWKKPEKKRRSLIRLGVDAGLAYACSRSRMGGWRIAQSPILNSTLTVARLKQRGYIAMMEYYREQRSS